MDDTKKVIGGSPATVVDQLRELAADLRVGHIILLMQLGSMDHELTKYNTRLFAEKVMPRLKPLFADRKLTLPGHGATMEDCCALTEMLLGAPPVGPVPLTLGILEIVSRVELDVIAVYTATGADGGAPAIEVKRIEAHRLSRS